MSTSDGHHGVCVRFFVELAALGVRHVVVSPGSRSTPLVLAAHAAGLELTVQVDERVAAFHALGLARASRSPVVLVCSSGTAGANYHPAVIEAHHSGIPLIVCTADRPPELRQWGAGQTIDQVHLFGRSVRWFFDMPVASEVDADRGAVAALRAVHTAVHEAGPVHLNWPFREPLEPVRPVEVPRPRSADRAERVRSLPSALLAELAGRHRRGLIVVGPDDLEPTTAQEILTFAAHHRWPVLADPASGLRSVAPVEGLITTGELLLAESALVDDLPSCDVVVRVGLAPTSKAYRLWIEARPPQELVLVGVGADWGDPTANATAVVPGPVAGVFADPSGPEADPDAWWSWWVDADRVAAAAVTTRLDLDQGELGRVAQLIAALADRPANLVVSNSMPVREVEFALRSAPSLRVIANRGANGIDGVVATGAGMAAGTEHPTVVLVGDVAAVHDLGGLASVPRLGLEQVTVVVLDNGGGGIFSILPVSRVLDPDAFEALYTTPHGTDLAAVGAALGYAVTEVGPGAPLVLPSGPGPHLVVVRTDVASMTAGVQELRAAVRRALA